MLDARLLGVLLKEHLTLALLYFGQADVQVYDPSYGHMKMVHGCDVVHRRHDIEQGEAALRHLHTNNFVLGESTSIQHDRHRKEQ